MKQRKLGPFTVSAVGLGCMNFAHGYGNALNREDSATLLLKALDLGYTHFDTATMYGGGKSEEIIGETIGSRPGRIFPRQQVRSLSGQGRQAA